MTEVYLADGLPGRYWAYLFDRIAINTGNSQSFGTQGRCVATKKWEPTNLEQQDTVDVRRHAFGLGKLSEYLAMMSDGCH